MRSEERYPGYWEDVRLTGIVPSPRQIAHQKMEYFGFIHFTVNTLPGKNGEAGKNPLRCSIPKSWMLGSGPKRRPKEA